MKIIEMVNACFPGDLNELDRHGLTDTCHRCGCLVDTRLMISAIDGKPNMGRELHAHWHLAVEQSI